MQTNISTLKSWFTTGKFPTQTQFWAWLDSYRHKDDPIPVVQINGLNTLLDVKADAELLSNHINDINAHTALIQADSFTALPQVGEVEKIYVTIDTNKLYYWRDNAYTELTNSQDLQSVTDKGNTTTNPITVPQIDLLEPEGTYSSTIKSQGLSEDRELLAPDSSGYIATEDYVVQQLFDGIATKQDKFFYLKKANGIVSVTGTLSETQVFRQSFKMNDTNFGFNSYGLGFFLNIFSLFQKVGVLSGYTIRVKLSTNATMPSGTSEQIAVFNGENTNLYAPFTRNFSIIRPVSLGNMQIHGFPFTTSAINDFAVSATATTSRDVLHGDTYYLYVSVQLTTSTADTLNFVSLKASNV